MFGLFKKKSSFKSSKDKYRIINTYYAFASSVDNRVFNKKSEFCVYEFNAGFDKLVIKISNSMPMEFLIEGAPMKMKKSIFFTLISVDGKIKDISMMVSEKTAHVTFPDKSIISFTKEKDFN